MRTDRSDWRRKHDDRRARPVVTDPAAHFFPESREDLIDVVRRSLTAQDPQVRACGSHWALSGAAVTEGFVVETRGFSEPDGFPSAGFLNKSLYDVIPGCLTRASLAALIAQPERPFRGTEPDLESWNYFHVEAGVRIFDLYSRLDLRSGNPGDSTPPELNMPSSRHSATRDVTALQGPWAMPTLGGAGGQTVTGAFSTGTHGGDQHSTPIADAVQAIHLIAPDGAEYWIEREFGPQQEALSLVDDKLLRAVYPDIRIVRNDDVFNAVLVSVGRLGIIYSIVIRVVRQYGLRQQRWVDTWASISARLVDRTDPLFASRFLQVVVNPHADVASGSVRAGTSHTCYVEQRWAEGLAAEGEWRGPGQRAGANAGSKAPIGTGELQSLICSVGSAAALVLGVKGLIAGAIGIVLALPLGFLAVPPLLILDGALTPFLTYTGTLGELVADLTDLALSLGMPWFVALVNNEFLSFGQPPIPPPGRSDISYAIMDFYDYSDHGCIPAAESLTVSFDADGRGHIAFLDTLFLRMQELEAGTLVPPAAPGRLPLPTGTPQSFAGYVSMRFTGRTGALIGMQRWDRTCNIEIAGIRGITGTDPFLRTLEADATNAGGTVHWGQKNESGLAQVEAVFPDLDRWRAVLSLFTANGRLTNFSTPFSRAKGLEVVQPRAGSLQLSYHFAPLGDPVTVTWDASDNPPGTLLRLRVMPTGAMVSDIDIPLTGSMDLRLPRGDTRLRLTTSFTFGGSTREDATRDQLFVAFADGDIYRLTGTATCREVDGHSRWATSLTLRESDWSPHLLAGNMSLPGAGRAVFVRREGGATVLLTSPAVGVEFPAAVGMNGDWLIFQQAENCDGEPPELGVRVRTRSG